MLTWVVTAAGIALCFWIGVDQFSLNPWTVLWAVFVSNLSAFIALVAVLALERNPKAKALIADTPRTWILFSGLYTGILVVMVPELRDLRPLSWMFFPLVAATGFGVYAFGPVQDFLVGRAQRKARGQPNKVFSASR